MDTTPSVANVSSGLKHCVFLAQTDTTVGFLSQDAERLAQIKRRDATKAFLKVVSSFEHITQRVPRAHRRRLRYARKSTFILQDHAFRYIDEPHHRPLVERFGWLYSTSANLSGEEYDPVFARAVADCVVEDCRGLAALSPSRLYRLGRHRVQSLR